MKNYKKILLLALISVFTFSICINVNAAQVVIKETSKSNDYKKSCNIDGKNDVPNATYKLEVDLGAKAGVYHLSATYGVFKIVAVEEGWYYTDGRFVAEPQVTHLATDINMLLDSSKTLIIGKNSDKNQNGQTVTVTAKTFIDNTNISSRERVLRVTVELAKSDEYCQSDEDFKKSQANGEKAGKYTGYYYLALRDFDEKQLQVQNKNYNYGACQAIRTCSAANDSKGKAAIDASTLSKCSLDQAAQKKYAALVPNCYTAGMVSYNYDEDVVKQMVQTALLSYYASLVKKSATPKTQEWYDSFNRAKNAGGEHYQPNLAKGTKPKTDTALECRFEWEYLGEDNKTGSYQYTNIQSYYAKTSTSVGISYYATYDGESRKKIAEYPNACVRTCEEVVDVEYGPPQAAVAGFCIEYQVKVTSHVRCETITDVKAPSQEGVCQPTPNCVHATFTSTQGGPNAEFDTCIKQCDGGQYTDSCSKKCYNKVYSSNNKENLTSSFGTGSIEFIAEIPQGGYYTRKDGKIVWISQSSNGKVSRVGTTYAQWYIDHEKSRTYKDDKNNGGLYFADTGGFKRQLLANGRECDGKCSHQNCSSHSYLRAESAQADYITNLDEYNKAVNECAAAATCTTKTAKFQISVDVDGQHISYPATLTGEDWDSLDSKDELSDRTENVERNKGTRLSYAGCYKSGKEKDWYQEEWSFPGTWVNNKTGEISFKKPTDSTVWHQTNKKFCLPLTIKNVNEKWWNYYMNKKQQKTGSSNASGSYKNDDYNNKYPGISSVNSVSRSDIKYNIHAKTMEFGYFGWAFNIDCFYAVGGTNTTGAPPSAPKCKDCGEQLTPDNYQTRSVENTDLFPSDDEDSPTASSFDSTGRQQGFNWSAAASISNIKNPYYEVNPQALIQRIQRIGSDIYKEENEAEYLDYEFHLDTQALNAIKKLNYNSNTSQGNYNIWLGESNYDSKKKIYVYKSGLFRGNGVISNKKYAWKIPEENKLGCNNSKCASNTNK